MKILVISDNHSYEKEVDKILKKEIFDIAIHTGDSEKNKEWLKKRFTYFVAGNNDYFYEPEEISIDLNGLKTFILHGHTQGIYVFTQHKPIAKILKRKKYDLIIHGHSHIFRNDIINDSIVLCSGSTNFSRGPEGNGYLTFEIKNKKVINVVFHKI